MDPLQVLQILLLVAAAILWIGGGNYLFYRRYQALGQSGWTFLHPFRFHFKILTGRDWLVLLGLFVATMTLGFLAIMLTPVIVERAAV